MKLSESSLILCDIIKTDEIRKMWQMLYKQLDLLIIACAAAITASPLHFISSAFSTFFLLYYIII